MRKSLPVCFLAVMVGYIVAELIPYNRIFPFLPYSPEIIFHGLTFLTGFLFGYFHPGYWFTCAVLLSLPFFARMVLSVVIESNIFPIVIALMAISFFLTLAGAFLGKVVGGR